MVSCRVFFISFDILCFAFFSARALGDLDFSRLSPVIRSGVPAQEGVSSTREVSSRTNRQGCFRRSLAVVVLETVSCG